MKTLRATARQTEQRDQQIQGVLAKYPSLRAAWSETEEADETIVTSIDVEVGDDAVERLASDLRACGWVVKVYTGSAAARRAGGLDDDTLS